MADVPAGFSGHERISEDEFSTAYRAYQEAGARTVLLTVYEATVADRSARRRVRSVFLATAALRGRPGILGVHEAGFTPDGHPFTVTESVDGGTLAGYLSGRGPLPAGEVVTLASDLVAALWTASREGVLHLDVRPENILLPYAGPAALTGFGAVHALRSIAVPIPPVLLVHAPRELFGWQTPSSATDVYQMGSTLYTLLSGRTPYAAEVRLGRAALYQRVLRGDPPPLTHGDVPPAMAELVYAMLAVEPPARPALSDVAEALARIAQSIDARRIHQGWRAARTAVADGGSYLDDTSGRAEVPIHASGPESDAGSRSDWPSGNGSAGADEPSAQMARPEPEAVPEADPEADPETVSEIEPQVQPRGWTPERPPDEQTRPIEPADPAPVHHHGIEFDRTLGRPVQPGPPVLPDVPPHRVDHPTATRHLRLTPTDLTPIDRSRGLEAAEDQPVLAADMGRPAVSVLSPERPFESSSPKTLPSEVPLSEVPRTARPGHRYAGLVLLAVIGLVALAAGLAWGAATSSSPARPAATVSPTPSAQPVTGSPTLLAEPELSDYRVASVTAAGQPGGVLVSWQSSRRTDHILVFVVVSEVNDRPSGQQTVGANARSVMFTGLQPGRSYCFEVATLVQQPAQSSGMTAAQPVCASTSGPPPTPGQSSP